MRSKTSGRLLLPIVPVLLGLIASSPAHAYQFDESGFLRWPFDTITYHVDSGPRAPATVAAFRAWNRARVGWRFERVRSDHPDAADIVVQKNLRRRPGACLGGATRGYAYSQAIVLVYGQQCRHRRVLSLVVAHELGHVLGLAEEPDVCALMNPKLTGLGRLVRPGRCRSPADLVRADDRRGARALYRRRFAGRRSWCAPQDERPVFAHEPGCRYKFDCRGVQGENVVDSDDDRVTETKPVDSLIHTRCSRQLNLERLPGGGPLGSTLRTSASGSSFAGRTSQGLNGSFSIRHGRLQNLSLGLHFTCSDGSRTFPRADSFGHIGDETVGPFPPLPVGRRGFRLSLQSPARTAVYELGARPVGAGWQLSARIFEGWKLTSLRYVNGEPRVRVAPDPDGDFVCDTGDVTLSAAPTS